MTIETITGDLCAVVQFEEGTLQHWDELSRDQIQDKSLRGRWFYVADFPLYTARGGKPVLALARHTKAHPHNLILKHLFDEQDNSYDQLIKTGNFRPHQDEAHRVLEAADTLKIEMSALRLSGDNNVYRFLRIRTKDGFVGVSNNRTYQRPNEVEQALIHRAGYTEEFLDMSRSKSYAIRETRVYLLNPDYVVAEAGEQFVGLAAWRGNFDDGANSGASDRNVNFHGGLRGVRLVSREAAAPENVRVPGAPSVASEISPPTMEEILCYTEERK